MQGLKCHHYAPGIHARFHQYTEGLWWIITQVEADDFLNFSVLTNLSLSTSRAATQPVN